MTNAVITSTDEYMKIVYNDTDSKEVAGYYNRKDIKEVELRTTGQVCVIFSQGKTKYFSVESMTGTKIVDSFGGVDTTTNEQLSIDLAVLIK